MAERHAVNRAAVQPTNPEALSPALLRSPIAGPYLVAPQWARWLQASWGRQGGAQAPSNADLDTAQQATQAELDATQAELDQTQADLAATQADLATTQADLDQTQETLSGTQEDLTDLTTTLNTRVPVPQPPLSVTRYDASGAALEGTPGLTTLTTGEVGVMGEVPQVGTSLSVQGQTLLTRSGGVVQLSMRAYGPNNATRPVLIAVAARGTALLPTNTAANQSLLRVQGHGHDGSVQTAMRAQVDLQTTEAFTATAQGTRVTVSTTLTGTTTTAERVRIDGNGFVGLCGATPTAPLDVQGDTLRLRTARTPASATAAGNAGDVCWDANYLYVCVGASQWKRAALATW